MLVQSPTAERHNGPVNSVTLALPVIITLGIAAQLLASKARLPAILPLLLIGFAVGPLTGLIHPTKLFGGGLTPLVSLAVGVILFEGGLTLRLKEIRGQGGSVFRLVTLGAAVTWGLAALAATLLTGMPWNVAVLFGALVMVTGPTVIGPLLRGVRVTPNVERVLTWEGILIDILGALAALLAYEAVFRTAPGELLLQFTRFVLVGAAVGIPFGLLLAWALRHEFIPDHLINVTSLSLVFLAFGVSDHFAEESGLLATTLMGVVVANAGVPRGETLRTFKEELVVLLISVLFVVLAANVPRSALNATLELRNLAVLAALVLLVRPLSVFLSTLGSRLNWRERAFVAWTAPRGIVAAAVSSILALRLERAGVEGAGDLLPLVFTVIVGTGVLASLTSRPVARALLVAQPEPYGYLLLGAHPLARDLASVLQEEGVNVVLGDTNFDHVQVAKLRGLNAYYGSLVGERSDEELDLSGMGRLIALTPNDEANALTALRYAKIFGHPSVYQLRPARANERNRVGRDRRAKIAFEGNPTYADLLKQYDGGQTVRRTTVTDQYPLSRYRADNPGARVLLHGDDGVFEVTPEEVPDLPSGTTIITLAPPRLDAPGERPHVA